MQKFDYEILNFLSHNPNSTILQIKQNNPKIDAIEVRIRDLEFIHHPLIAQNITNGNSQYSKKDGTYHLTDYGIVAMQNYKHEKRTRKKELWLKNAWIPIIVAFITTLLSNYLLPKLLNLLK